MINLMYHDISFGLDMSSGFQTEVSMAYKVDAIEFEKHVKQCVGKNVVFSFDDGGVSFYTEAAPILERYGFKGVFFISTAFIGKPGFLTEEQIRDLDARGHIIGSHTHNHLRNLSLFDRETIENEWNKSVDVLSKILNKRVRYASLPNGDGSTVVYDAIRKTGITEIYTSVPTTKIVKKDGVNIFGRYTILNSFSSTKVRSIVFSKGTRNRMYIKWYVISIIKKVLGKQYYNLRRLIATH